MFEYFKLLLNGLSNCEDERVRQIEVVANTLRQHFRGNESLVLVVAEEIPKLDAFHLHVESDRHQLDWLIRVPEEARVVGLFGRAPGTNVGARIRMRHTRRDRRAVNGC